MDTSADERAAPGATHSASSNDSGSGSGAAADPAADDRGVDGGPASDPAAYARVCAIFEHAADLAAAEREAYLAEACADEEALRQHVEEALAAAETDEATGFLAESLVSERARTASLPDRIGPYRIVGRLGAGGMGEVFLAEEDFPRRQVALKVIRLGALSGSAAERFEREAELLGRLHHPAIAPVHAAGLLDLPEGRLAYLAMERVEGRSLAAILDGPEPLFTGRPGPGSVTPGTLDEIHRVVRWIEVAAEALQAAHDAGVVHRDVKPGNLIITPDDEPVLIDFGVARDLSGELGSLTATGLATPGTPAYMSPEQIDGDGAALDGRSDVWSLGVVLYECLCGQRPFDGGTRAVLGRRIASRDPADPRRGNPAVPRDLAAVLDRALEKEPSRRYPSAAAFAQDLARVRRGEPTMARPLTAAARVWRQLRRHPLTASVALAAAVLAALAAGTWFDWSLEAAAPAASQDLLAFLRVAESRGRGADADPTDLARLAALVPDVSQRERLLGAPTEQSSAAVLGLALDRHRGDGGQADLDGRIAPVGAVADLRPVFSVQLPPQASLDLTGARAVLEGLDGALSLEALDGVAGWRPVEPLLIGERYLLTLTLADGRALGGEVTVVDPAAARALRDAPSSGDLWLDALVTAAGLLELGLAADALTVLEEWPRLELEAAFAAADGDPHAPLVRERDEGSVAQLAAVQQALRDQALAALGVTDAASGAAPGSDG